MTTPQTFNVLGLVANAIGVLLLFRYGMPYRFAVTDGEILKTRIVRSEERQKDTRYRVWGYVGLALILLGTGFQIGATLNA